MYKLILCRKEDEEVTKEVFEWIKTIAISVIIALLITTFIARPTLVKQESMYPTLYENDYLILDKLSYRFQKPERGDIVVFEAALITADGDNKDLIKRVIGLEGDHVVVRDGRTYINDEELKEDYINGSYKRGNVDLVVPEDKVFVMGDNREISYDSRDIGPIDIQTIRGKVLVRLYPFNRIGKVD